MKKFFSVFPVLLIFIACKNNQSNLSYKDLFEHSMSIKDYHTAITSLQILMLADTVNRFYEDTLPELYAAVKNYDACNYYTDKALAKYPESEKYLQLKALCMQQAGNFEEELKLYQKLYTVTQKIPYLYQLTAYYFSSGQTKEAQTYLQQLEEKSKNATDSVDFMIDEVNKQKVPIQAAIYNMRAYMSAQNKDFAGAKKYFELAIKEFPDFITARQNYYQLMQGAGRRN